MKLNNETVVIELKNGTVINKTVTDFDISMKTHFKELKLSLKGRKVVVMDHLTIRGKLPLLFAS
jgi:small nuclear ribonucleoprotein D1